MRDSSEATAGTRDLSQGWTVSDGAHSVSLPVPGDVHSALLDAGLIADPYWRDTETSLDWIHESEWTATKHFDLAEIEGGHWTLSFDGVDCVADISLNGTLLGRVENRFLRHDFEVGHILTAGENCLEVHFLSSSAEAVRKAAASPYPVPYSTDNNRLRHTFETTICPWVLQRQPVTDQ